MGKEDGTERCGSRAAPTMDSLQGQPRHQQLQQRHKLDVYNEVLRRVKEAGRPEALLPSFEDGLWNHFNRLPARYAMDVNIERTEDVLMHQHLLEAAQDPAKRPAFTVRLIQVAPSFDVNPTNSSDSSIAGEEAHSTSTYCTGPSSVRPSTFDSTSNLESLALEASRHPVRDGDSCANAFRLIPRPMHEITISTDDRPKILSLLTSLLSGLGLNIQEAHAFSTNDGYSLDVFVVDGWDREETEELTDSLRKEIENMENKTFSKTQSWTPQRENAQSPEVATSDHVRIPTDGKDVWEIDFRQLKFGNKVASGTYGDLYRGTYCSQDVAIKVLKPDHITADMQREFAQEVYIMRKVRHKNVVQFIGACTRPPSLSIITEFMLGGSLYDHLHKQKGIFNLPTLLRVAIDISKGMNYLHQNSIIHRDLKTANLLMDENKVVKVADFGVARVKTQSGVMTAETGTYRWMAPEVIEHKPYDHKADVFSFGVVLWELITTKVPYEYLTPLQAAVGVVRKGLRPTIPKNTHPKLAELLERCWQHNPGHRPDFSEILEILGRISKEVEESENPHKKSGGFLSSLRRGH